MPEVLTFEHETHTYRVGDEVLLSVTQALKSAGVIDYSMIPQAVLQQAARRGTFVHRAIQFWLDGELDESTVPEGLIGYIDAAKRFLDASRFEVHRVECRHHHAALRYAGTWDVDGLFNGTDFTTVDWKTGMIMPGHAIQLAAYNNLRKNPRTARRMAVQLRADGSYRVHEYPSPEHPDCTFTRDIAIFESALSCAKWNTQHGGSNE